MVCSLVLKLAVTGLFLRLFADYGFHHPHNGQAQEGDRHRPVRPYPGGSACAHQRPYRNVEAELLPSIPAPRFFFLPLDSGSYFRIPGSYIRLQCCDFLSVSLRLLLLGHAEDTVRRAW
jgi:hypothetical protein